ncbi:MAG: hypothetical protein WB580_14150, partial [Candidatus Binataceae bacterium]
MKPVPMSWVISALVAICLTPGLSSFPRRGAAPQPTMLAQDDGAVAVPGSADAPAAPSANDDSDDQSGQAQNNGQTGDDPDAAQQPPANMQQPPADDSGDDTST